MDGASQTLNAKTLKEWNNATAYFNGDQIEVTLTIAPNEKDINFAIDKLGIGELDTTQSKSQCGSVDNRTDSNDDAIGRIVPIGCTGWIIRNGRFVTAGHCLTSRAQIIEFNVPKSNSNRSIVHPGPEDQYPIGNFVTNYVRGQVITDWGVFTAGANSITGLTPIQAQGKSFNVTRNNPQGPIRITGFGTDTGSDNQTQQTHQGPLTSFDGSFVNYQTDTTGGNSGSPIIDEATGNAVGVHAYGGCRTNGGSNFGERATIPSFWEAMGLDSGGNPPNPPTDDCDSLDFSDFQISSFSNQDAAGNFAVNGGGSTLALSNNTWKQIAFNYAVTDATVIEFDFRSTGQGEVHAIGFESDNELSPNLYFRVYGTQNYGVGDFDDYSGSGTKTYTIPVGDYYTGSGNRLVFINDNDAGSGNTSFFSNVKIYEGTCGNTSNFTEGVAGIYPEESVIIGDEDENPFGVFDLHPNPTSNNFSMTVGNLGNAKASATIYNILGQKQQEIALESGVNSFSASDLRLTVGMYLIEVKSTDGFSKTHKFVVKE